MAQVEKDPETIIINVDDDTYYHPDTVGDLVENIVRDPGHVMVSAESPALFATKCERERALPVQQMQGSNSGISRGHAYHGTTVSVNCKA